MTWSLFLLYFSAPALAVLIADTRCYDGRRHAVRQAAQWISAWNRVDPALLSVSDVSKDGLLQLRPGPHAIGGDIIVLATPAIGGACVRHLGHGGSRRPGRGAVDSRRPAAGDRQRAVARPVPTR
ncbi:MAG: hypothetical protein U1F25_15580 [Rubrivivax sp.]